jgi:hypothetical protein
MKLELSWQILDKYSNIKFHENPPTGSQILLCGYVVLRVEETDMNKITATFCNLANVPKKLGYQSVNIGTELDLFEG